MSEVKVNKISPRSGTTITLGDSGDTFTVPSGVTFDASSGGLAGTLTTAAQPNITSVGTLTSFTSTGIDDNATSTAITIDSSENVGIGTASPANLLHLTPSQNSTALQIANTNDTNGIRINSGVSGLSSNSLQFLNVSGDSLLIIDGTNKSTIVGNIGPSGYRASFGDFEVKNQDGANNSGGTLVLSNTDGSILSGQHLGNLTFASYDQSGATTTGGVASIRAIASETYGSTSGASLLFYTHPSSANNGTVDGNMSERVRIDSSGNVGIGTSSPTSELEVYGASTPKITVKSNDGTSSSLILRRGNADDAQTDFELKNNGGDLEFFGDNTSQNDYKLVRFSTTEHRYYTNNSERMRITSSGSVGIGTSSPSSTYKLSVSGNVVGAFIETTSTTSGHEASIIKRPNSGVLVQFLGSGQVGSITTNGSTTTYGTSSDYRLKENVVDLTNATERLKQLQPKRFNFIADANTTVDGFLAHEVSSVVPEAIHGTKDEVDVDGNPKYQNIDQSKLVPLLVKTIQELEARITTLENA